MQHESPDPVVDVEDLTFTDSDATQSYEAPHLDDTLKNLDGAGEKNDQPEDEDAHPSPAKKTRTRQARNVQSYGGKNALHGCIHRAYVFENVKMRMRKAMPFKVKLTW